MFPWDKQGANQCRIENMLWSLGKTNGKEIHLPGVYIHLLSPPEGSAGPPAPPGVQAHPPESRSLGLAPAPCAMESTGRVARM